LPGQPSPEVHLGAARAAERAAGGDGRAVADRAAPNGMRGGLGLGAADRSGRQVRDFLTGCGARPPRGASWLNDVKMRSIPHLINPARSVRALRGAAPCAQVITPRRAAGAMPAAVPPRPARP
jgi:hypothetical protein